jgi:hypothetical protein
MSPRRRLGIAAGTTAMSVAAMLGFGAAPAMASPSFCMNDLCVTEAAQTYNVLYLDTYANNQSVDGHFEVQTPEHTAYNSPQKTYAPGSGYTFALPYGSDADYGNYCVTLWKYLGPGDYEDIAYGCIVL